MKDGIRAHRTSVNSRVPWLKVAAAGGAASLLRFMVSGDGGWLTLLCVNLAGCALLGALLARGRATPVLAGGFCGALTTFSGLATQARLVGGAPVGAWTATGDSGALPAGPVSAALVLALSAALGCAVLLLARRVTPPLGGAPS